LKNQRPTSRRSAAEPPVAHTLVAHTMAIAITLVLIVIGSVAFHVFSPWWSTPLASNWQYVDDTITFTFWITGLAFTIIILFMAYCIFQYRHREGRRAEYEPENKKLEWILIGATAVGVAAMLAPGLIVWKQFITVPANATEIEVVGQQWQWSFRLPGSDGRLGKADTRLVGGRNALGLSPSDPDALDDIVIDGGDLHLPIGKPVKLLLRSIDVLHDFYVPQFRVKMDMVPGLVTYVWFVPTKIGKFDILCAELCGTAHAQMRASVVVDEESAYQVWLDKQRTFAQVLARVRK
jgi:cytochrome c oxidase subunit II